MKIKYFLIFWFFINIFVKSQNISISPILIVSYKFVFQSDSTNVNSKSSDLLSLYIDNRQSLFESSTRKELDSFFIAHKSNNSIINFDDVPKPIVTTFIYKNNENNTNLFADDFIKLKLKYEYPNIDFKWKLINETKNILGYKCSKAKTNFGGRIWIAWYSTELPFNNGPYKFKGLPGLIMEIEDKNNFFKYTVVGIKKNKSDMLINRNFNKNYVDLGSKNYYEVKSNYIKSKFPKTKLQINPIEK
ncbi:GLPGLI family protein [Halpernia sp.]|uniref:GLPGLI family protein n=1 Tax=Halpernia sp. TaxID=2782209 RepID=UPI003A8CE0ED